MEFVISNFKVTQSQKTSQVNILQKMIKMIKLPKNSTSQRLTNDLINYKT